VWEPQQGMENNDIDLFDIVSPLVMEFFLVYLYFGINSSKIPHEFAKAFLFRLTFWLART